MSFDVGTSVEQSAKELHVRANKGRQKRLKKGRRRGEGGGGRNTAPQELFPRVFLGEREGGLALLNFLYGRTSYYYLSLCRDFFPIPSPQLRGFHGVTGE